MVQKKNKINPLDVAMRQVDIAAAKLNLDPASAKRSGRQSAN